MVLCLVLSLRRKSSNYLVMRRFQIYNVLAFDCATPETWVSRPNGLGVCILQLWQKKEVSSVFSAWLKFNLLRLRPKLMGRY